MGAALKPKPNVVPMRTLSEKEALAWLVQRGRIETSAAALARDWRWNSKKVKTHLDRWSLEGHIDVKPGLGGRTVISAITAPSPAEEAANAAGVPSAGPVVMRVAAPVAAVVDAAGADVASDVVEEESETPDGGAAAAVTAPAALKAASVVAPRLVASARPAPARISFPAAPSSAREGAAILSRPAGAPAPLVMHAAALSMPTPMRGSGFVNTLAYTIAVALAAIAAFFSISGMIVLFPGAPAAIVIMGVVMESAKLVTVAFLAHQWRMLAWLSRTVLVTLVAGLAAINAAGVYSQLVAAHFGDRATAESAVETQAAALAATTEVQAQAVTDLDRRVAQIDAAIAEMTRRGRASGALDAIATQRKQREALVAQRRQEAEKLVTLKTEAAAVAARNHKIEVEAAPIMYVAQMFGASTEQAIRMLILLMVLTCDPLALALTAAASRPRLRRS
ncbi:MAG: hypothetical protein J2P53_03710 [Bradyrhizobiaceae bacterium]|nr:hypothetical protein [Bradyrhizobiaceae bacterium]